MNKAKIFTAWLTVTSIMIIVMGLYMALLKTTGFFAPMNSIIDPVFWPNGISDSGSVNFKEFIFSLAGAMLTVWGIFLFFITRFAFSKGEQWAWVSILVTTLTWFTIDEFFSLSHQFYDNAIGNLALLLMLLIPLAFTCKDFFGKKK